MNNLEISPLESYDPQSADLLAAGIVVQTGFGGRTLDSCIEDAANHLRSAELVQYARHNNQLIGFAMYETFSEGRHLYLNGIVIREQSQAKKLGTVMVSQALTQLEAGRLFAVTRNPAVLRLMQSVCDYVEPTPECKSGSNLSSGELRTLASYIGVPAEDLPYHRGRYPADLYNVQPSHHNPAVQQEFNDYYSLDDTRDAVLLIGGISDAK